MDVITDPDDPRVAEFRDLKDRDLAREGQRFLVEGALLVERLLASPLRVQRILCSRQQWPDLQRHVPPDVEVVLADEVVVNAIVGFKFHRGAMAIAHRPDLPDPVATLRDAQPPAVLVALPATNDADNVGGIVRTAAALGCCGVLFGPQSSDPFYRRSVRVSMGAAFTLPLAHTNDFTGTLRRLRDEAGAQLVAAALVGDATPLHAALVRPRQVLLFGNEAHGLEPDLLSLADEIVTIPMARGIDSLNVAASAAVFCHHYRRTSG